ncbi:MULTISPECIES: glucokinase [Helicobacter]|uniref:glucokinase n=1 Tax=Helicobacter TaxID=209 RepID=UPI000EB281A4|nr:MULTISPECIES: glucokinase [Helicobacter]
MSSTPDKTYPRLLADIGGTNARFGLEVAPDKIECIEVFACQDYNTVVDAIKAYLAKTNNPPVKYAAIAIANPVVGDWVQMTNHHWAFSIETTRQALKLEVLILINDFTAQAYALSKLNTEELLQVGGSACELHAPKLVLGPGTGLGVSALIPCCDGSYTALAGEGGHVSFAPFDDTEIMIWHYARKKYGHVSAERFLSGAGLVLIHAALADREGMQPPQMTPEVISQQALSGKSPLCRLTLDIFCTILGTVASNMALILGARGGVYLSGGIIPRFIDYFKTSPFRLRFENKGRFAAYLAAIPVYVVLSKHPGLKGVAVALDNHLRVHP